MRANEHRWALNEFNTSTLDSWVQQWKYCSLCGVVQRRDGNNKPCPGKPAPVKLREQAQAQDAVDPVDGLVAPGPRA